MVWQQRHLELAGHRQLLFHLLILRAQFPRPFGDALFKFAIERLQGRLHQVVTGVSLIHLRAHRERIFAISTDILFYSLDAGQIRDYLSMINPLDKAGAYAIQEHGEKVVSQVYGSYSNVVGLPLERLREELELWGTR